MNEELGTQVEMNTFDDASKATSEMQPTTIDESQFVDETGAETLPDENATQGGEVPPVTEQAVQTAEVAAQVASEKDKQLQQALEQLKLVSNENAEIKGMLEQMSETQKEALVDEIMEMPMLDIGSLAFDDEDTIKSKQSEYAQKMARFTEKQVMDKLSPFVKQAEEAQLEKQKQETLSMLSTIPELEGITELLPQLDKIIANNKALSSPDVPIDEKYITAFAIAKGVNSMNTPVQNELSPQELLDLYENNTEFQDLVEQKRLEKVKGNQQVPTFSASSGAVNAALNIKEKPTTFEEASRRTREMFGN